MNNIKKITILIVYLLLGLVLQVNALTLSIDQPVKISGIYITPSEFNELPEHLQVKVKYHYKHGEPLYRKWAKKYGVDYQHFHHWAAALVKYKRAMAHKNRAKRDFALKETLGEYNYLLRHCTPKNPLRYYFHYKKGEVLLALNKPANAVNELTTSLKYNKRFLQSYLKLSEAYSRLGMRKESNEVLALAKKRLTEKPDD